MLDPWVWRPPINAPVRLAGQPLAASTVPPAARPSLRIALLGYRSSPFSGGQGIYLKYLSRALVRQGHEVTVISGPPYPNLDSGVPLVELPGLDLYTHGLGSVTPQQLMSDRLARMEWLSKLSGGFAEPWTFGERVRDWLLPRLADFDIVHDNQTLSDGVLDIQKAGVPLVTTVHHPIIRDYRLAMSAQQRWHRRLLVARWYRFLGMQGRVARELNHIVTVSGASRRDIVGDFGVDPRRIAVLHNGVDTELFRPLPDIERKPCQIMATASADAPSKGLGVLLRAAAALVRDWPDLSLVLVGRPRPGGDTETLITELSLADRIRWVGGIDDTDMVELYAESTVAVVPSLYEGFGLPAVEAMACAMPLVSSDGGALPEVVGDGGVLVPAGDDRALATALNELLSDAPARRELANRARQRVEAHFSWDVCGERMAAYYRERLARC